MTFTLYRFLTDIAAWPLRAALRWRSWRGKEDPCRLAERHGTTSHPRPEGQLVWFHAASVGESITLLPLIERFCSLPDTHVLLTTGTITSAQVIAERLPPGARHQFAPWDRQSWVESFLDHWQPDIAIRMESEIWPNTIDLIHRRNIPIAVINGRLSPQSVRGWSRFSSFASDVFEAIDLTVAQSDSFAAAFRQLGARHVRVAPNLKLSAAPLPVDNGALTELQLAVGARHVWSAVSTHDGEEQIVINVHRALSENLPGLLTIIAPRHFHRGSDIEKQAIDAGLGVARRSKGQTITDTTDIYVADTLGELGLFFKISPVVFMGKSLTAIGGQNPIEAAHFGCAILFGNHMENFEDIAAAMLTNSMAKQVKDESSLMQAVSLFLTDDTQREIYAINAKTLIQNGADGLTVTYSALQNLLAGHGNNGR